MINSILFLFVYLLQQLEYINILNYYTKLSFPQLSIMMRTPTISNVVSCGELQKDEELDLAFIASKVEGSRLNLKKFPALIIRKTKPKGTILLFKNGKFLIIGGDSIQNSQIICRRLGKQIQKLLNSSKIDIKTSRVANIIANGHLGFEVNLSKAAELPNAFKDDKSPALLIRLLTVKSAMVFKSGKVVLNGTTKEENILEAFHELRRILEEFKIIVSTEMDIQEPSQKQKKKKGKSKKKGKKKKNVDAIEQEVQGATNTQDQFQMNSHKDD